MKEALGKSTGAGAPCFCRQAVFPAQTLPQRGCCHGTHPLPIPGDPAPSGVVWTLAWACLFEGLAHPQQLSPLPLHPKDPSLESKAPHFTFQKRALRTLLPLPILHILNSAAWLQPLPSDLHDNRAAFQVHPVPKGVGGFRLSPPSSLEGGTRHSTGDKRGGRVGGPQSSAPSSST